MKVELARSKVTTQDQTSVPAEVRKRFGIKSGCELGWYEEGGRLFVDLARPNTLADARQALKGKSSPKSLKEIKEGIKGQVGEKFKRARR
jgi:bifunctional DNA-binding transcriptional regulator/antitoxin component of YhaV-PrlF toxin-antitoxin module